MKMHLQMLSAKWRPFYLDLKVLVGINTWIRNHINSSAYDVVTHPSPSKVVKLNRQWSKGMYVQSFPIIYINEIIYPYRKPYAGSTNIL